MEQGKERRRRLKRATIANAGLMVFSAAAALITKNDAFIAETVHDLADTTAHGTRWAAEAEGVNQNTNSFRKMRRMTMLILSSLSAYAAIRLGVDIYQGLEESSSKSQEMIEFVGSIAIAGGNVYAYKQVNAIEEHSHASHDSHHHARTDMVASLGLSACIAADAVGVNGAAEWGGLVFASYTTYELFPTNARINHH